jgi:hypothetical protein
MYVSLIRKYVLTTSDRDLLWDTDFGDRSREMTHKIREYISGLPGVYPLRLILRDELWSGKVTIRQIRDFTDWLYERKHIR